MDEGSPCPEDGDFFDARPDAAETEEVINKFIRNLDNTSCQAPDLSTHVYVHVCT